MGLAPSPSAMALTPAQQRTVDLARAPQPEAVARQVVATVAGPGSGKTLAYLIAALYRAEMQTNDEGLSSSSSSTGGPVHLVVSATTDLGKQQAQELQISRR